VILHPSVLALVVASLVTSGMLAYAARWAIVILRRWDLRSGSALQLELERRTVLLSTLLRHVIAFELASLFLYVHTADGLAPLFTGAMCAAGTLKASAWGYPVLLLKLANFVLAGVWLALNHVDGEAPDHPLIRPKYGLLLALVPPVLAEAGLQARYFAELRPEVITSCCGSLFARSGGGLAGGLAALPVEPTRLAYFAIIAAAVGAGALFRARGRGGWLLAAASAIAIPVGLASVVAFVSPYVYELPTHRCPFCLLQREYGFVGYPLYGALLGGGVAGIALGAVMPFRHVPSLARTVPAFQRRLASVAVALFTALLALTAYEVATSSLRM
jgi:hypothetical protein